MVTRFLTPNILAFLAVNAVPFLLLLFVRVVADLAGIEVKSAKPVLAALCWLLWATGSVLFLLNSPWRHTVMPGYAGLLGVLAWLKRRYLFENPKSPANSLSRLLEVPVPTYIPVRDVAAVSSWYVDKFGLRRLAATQAIPAERAVFQFREETEPLILLPTDPADPRPVPVLYTRKIMKVRDALVARVVSAGEVQRDRQGTRHFELRDPEGNPIEVSEEP
jgi:catechol 2,3-dioxygenase-like lactoylglutathione lyase family enzyme